MPTADVSIGFSVSTPAFAYPIGAKSDVDGSAISASSTANDIAVNTTGAAIAAENGTVTNFAPYQNAYDGISFAAGYTQTPIWNYQRRYDQDKTAEILAARQAIIAGGSNVKIISSNADWSDINNSQYQYFGVEPGDYRGASIADITADGTEANPKYILWYDGTTAATSAIDQSDANRAKITIPFHFRNASWWVIEGLTIDANGTSGSYIAGCEGSAGCHNIHWAHNLIENGQRVHLRVYTPSSNIMIRENVIRNSWSSVSGGESTGIILRREVETDSENIKIIGNEIFNMKGDCFQTGATLASDGIVRDGRFINCVIEDNDMYITNALYTDGVGMYTAGSSSYDPNGTFAESENAIDFKVGGSRTPSSIGDIFIVCGNRTWGWRRSDSSIGANTDNNFAAAFDTHYANGDYILFRDNIIFDSNGGYWASDSRTNHISLINNIFWDVATVDVDNYGRSAQGTLGVDKADRIECSFNTIIESGRWTRTGSEANIYVRGNLIVFPETLDADIGSSGTQEVAHNAVLRPTSVSSFGTSIDVNKTASTFTQGSFSTGDLVLPTSTNGCLYVVTSGGTSGSQPTWPTTLDATVISDGVTFRAIAVNAPVTIKRLTAPEVKNIPYAQWSTHSSNPYRSTPTSGSGIGAETNIGVDNSTPS